MDYKQRYKEALDEAKAIHKAIKQDLKPVIEQIFPELKENRVEKPNGGIVLEDLNEGDGFYKVNLAYLSKEQVEEIENLVKKWNPESDDDRIRKAIICGMNALKKGNRIYFAGIYIDDILAWLEKQGEQEIVDEVKPKFNLYDWVVTDKGDVVQIGAVNNGYYTLCNGMDFNMSYVDKCWHLWTIKDAKDGDVLFHSDSASNGIFIFKELLKYEFGEKVICYCDYDSEDHFCLGEHHTCCWADAKILHPATKEQCETLFEKMKLEGYRWDEDEKKIIRFERFVRREESDFAFKEDENGVIKFIHKKSKV